MQPAHNVSWLSRRAEEAAHDIAYDNPGAQDIANAIEKVAREFAERALISLNETFAEYDGAGLGKHEIRNAIDAAEKD